MTCEYATFIASRNQTENELWPLNANAYTIGQLMSRGFRSYTSIQHAFQAAS